MTVKKGATGTGAQLCQVAGNSVNLQRPLNPAQIMTGGGVWFFGAGKQGFGHSDFEQSGAGLDAPALIPKGSCVVCQWMSDGELVGFVTQSLKMR